MTAFPQSLIDAAALERDRRAVSYPPAIEARRMTAEAATSDYQAWVAIAVFLDTAKFLSFAGGVDGDTLIDWPFLERAAAQAVRTIGDKLEKEVAFAARPRTADDGDREPLPPEDMADLEHRCACLIAIHRAVQRRGEWFAETNRQLRAAVQQDIAAQAAA